MLSLSSEGGVWGQRHGIEGVEFGDPEEGNRERVLSVAEEQTLQGSCGVQRSCTEL